MKKKPRQMRKVTKKWTKESRFPKKMKKPRLRMKVTQKWMRRSSLRRKVTQKWGKKSTFLTEEELEAGQVLPGGQRGALYEHTPPGGGPVGPLYRSTHLLVEPRRS